MPKTKQNTPPPAPAKAGVVETTGGTAKVTKQPQSKLQAAKAARMFLYTDDGWSQRYFNSGDLHCEERELFG